MSKLILFWHRRDLRISDNIGLVKAREISPKIVGLFCLDPNILKSDDMASVRIKYLLGCLEDLKKSYQQVGSQLLIIQGNPLETIPQLANQLKAYAVYWNLDVEPYSQTRDKDLKNTLEQQGIICQTYWDQLLHSPGEVMSKTETPYTIYTPFWNNWFSQDKPKPVTDLKDCQSLAESELLVIKNNCLQSLPSLQELGFIWNDNLIFPAGEKLAYERLENFCTNCIENYDEKRNFPAIDGTSMLSPALKFGVIGIRKVWELSQEMYQQSRSEEGMKNILTWQKEIAWREFYQHALFFFPELLQGAYRKEFKNFPWDDNESYFEAWCEGKTGYPIVDASMRQLNETGWMHNRCRMIVASFLTKDLMINWQWGEKYFMQHLIDGDLSANNGGWQWSASSGMDPRPLRIFNPASQAQKFDPEGEYIRTWLPELRGLETEDLLTGKISDFTRYSVNYPQPIVNHHLQQQEFKRRYQLVKANG